MNEHHGGFSAAAFKVIAFLFSVYTLNKNSFTCVDPLSRDHVTGVSGYSHATSYIYDAFLNNVLQVV